MVAGVDPEVKGQVCSIVLVVLEDLVDLIV